MFGTFRVSTLTRDIFEGDYGAALVAPAFTDVKDQGCAWVWPARLYLAAPC